ncbi:MAG TPA: hypothetical protein VFA60_01415 [Terriglobales bacterium]|nr:hypothetical protein [Terriglobales bacterium]
MRALPILLFAVLSAAAFAQTAAPPATSPQARQPGAKSTPPVKVNYLNVCMPDADQQKEIAAALARIPERPRFVADFEVARGRSTAPDAPVSHWVRLRREFAADSPFVTAQYTFSHDALGMAETLVFRLRDPADLVQVALEDKVTSGMPAAVLASQTPASRIRIERLGKGAYSLSRCPDVDQHAYEPLFAGATRLMSAYRRAMDAPRTVAADLARLGVPGTTAGAKTAPAAKATNSGPAKKASATAAAPK